MRICSYTMDLMSLHARVNLNNNRLVYEESIGVWLDSFHKK